MLVASKRSFTLGWVFGLLTGASLSAVGATIPYDRLTVFAEALSIIEDRYVDAREPDALVYDAIGGLTQGLDDHSVFLDPDEARRLKEETSGEYIGIGVTLDAKADALTVLTTLEGSPAEDVGVRPGDRIVAIDGQRVQAVGADMALERIKGPSGSVVVLTLARGADEVDLRLERGPVRARSVVGHRLDEQAGYLRIERFQLNTGDELKRALATLRPRPKDMASLVLDLRGNPGGYLTQAIAVSDIFLPEGAIVHTLERGAPLRTESARGPGTIADLAVVALVDGGSASAAEIVAGALQDHGRARLLGYPTYGKGSVQQFFDLRDGSALKITVARYLTPNKASIHGSGIRPDWVLGERGATSPDIDIRAVLASAPAAPAWAPEDHALRLAWLALRDPSALDFLKRPATP